MWKNQVKHAEPTPGRDIPVETWHWPERASPPERTPRREAIAA
jgi:hypothetical protein